MRIESSNLNLSGDSSTISYSRLEENFKFWTTEGSTSAGMIDIQDFSADALKTTSFLSSSSVNNTEQIDEQDMVDQEHTIVIKMLEAFIKGMTGKKVHLQVPRIKLSTDGYNSSGQALTSIRLTSSGLQQGSAGFGLIYNRNEIQAERTRVSFAAEGIVKTADGREINLDLNFNIDQQIVQQSSFQLKAGDALKDPLVINFGGNLASFTNRTMSFDLDYDGTMDTISQLGSNSGYLVLDKNGNGAVDDGRELFGPQTDNGYEELAKYDEDGNGWIDEGDSIFDQLKIWYHDDAGNSHLVALTDKDVGAVYLGHVNTQMNMYNQTGMAGRLRESGLVLLENGQSRIMQELDVRI